MSLTALVAVDGAAAWAAVGAADLAWLGLWWLDLRRTPPISALDVERDAPRTASVGRAIEWTLRWRLRTGAAVLEVVEQLPTPLDDGTDPVRRLSVDARWREERCTVIPARRGVGTADALFVRLAGPWGLAARRGTLRQSWSLTVLPPMPVRVAALPTARQRLAVGARTDRRAGDGRELDSLRDWVPGDDSRTLDWKATARRGKPIVRRYRDERRQPVLLALDAGRLMAAEHEGRSRFDAAVDAAAALAWATAAHDDDVGLVVFDAAVRTSRAPMRGQVGLRRVLEGLAASSAQPVEPDYPAALAALARAQRRRALVVLFSDVVDAATSAALVAQAGHLRPRHVPVLVTLRDPALEAAASRPLAGVADAYARGAAESLREARAAALERVRGDGVIVVDAAPSGAAAAVVAAYERLKRRGVL
jgi:uncharacterized protein (DUF58 family)